MASDPADLELQNMIIKGMQEEVITTLRTPDSKALMTALLFLIKHTGEIKGTVQTHTAALGIIAGQLGIDGDEMRRLLHKYTKPEPQS